MREDGGGGEMGVIGEGGGGGRFTLARSQPVDDVTKHESVTQIRIVTNARPRLYR